MSDANDEEESIYAEKPDFVYTKTMRIDDLDRIRKTEDMFEIIKLTKRPNAEVRLKAA